MKSEDKQSQTDINQSLDLISRYVSAIQDQDGEKMRNLKSPDFVLDLVAGDAFDESQRTESEAREFWPAWFSAFSEYDYQVTRTIATESVVVTEWQFIGTNTGKLISENFGKEVEPTQKTIQFRGVSIYEMDQNLINRETVYLDLATLWVELGVGE